jgi:Family of unknown function (DUF5683)
MKSLLAAAIIVFYTSTSFSQEVKKDIIPAVRLDSISANNPKVISIETYAQRFNPRKAILFSAILPGMGQVYNKKYWKVPLVYGGLIGFGLVIDFYNNQNNKYRDQLFDLLNTGVQVSSLTETQLRSIIEKSSRQRDYFIIITGFFYILQMIDAHVDAHLKEFELNPKLKVRVEPMMDSNYYTGTSTGIVIKFRF